MLCVLIAAGLVIAALSRKSETGQRHLAAAGFLWPQALLLAVVMAVVAMLLQPLGPLFCRRSPAGQVLGAQQPIDGVCSAIAFSCWPSTPQIGRYTLAANWRPFLYCRRCLPWKRITASSSTWMGPDGQTYASTDELNPANIPTANWPPGLYVRNPLTLDLPETLPAIRYTLTAGLYNHHTGDRLPVTRCQRCSIPGRE